MTGSISQYQFSKSISLISNTTSVRLPVMQNSLPSARPPLYFESIISKGLYSLLVSY
ncbi:hypothetical protein BABINDRAFT_159065 [Babjeviella inositovora NRRL Y-12698]|uniref:Uncharacterized protein n=1 Tax=Babjeviella inositovora NRRL Y-12698 TaxID=984486 RepID=A0A1E3QXX3_9ASCO|nr:uncharacterized protein BABINDRAFT_159065 [Babjeviella inositovora NRRL Y-12698]ODQ82486.1 hypothetical protein BABINDRAFT_159065 [Babjeviella inositovora NRRL Y-12698]